MKRYFDSAQRRQLRVTKYGDEEGHSSASSSSSSGSASSSGISNGGGIGATISTTTSTTAISSNNSTSSSSGGFAMFSAPIRPMQLTRTPYIGKTNITSSSSSSSSSSNITTSSSTTSNSREDVQGSGGVALGLRNRQPLSSSSRSSSGTSNSGTNLSTIGSYNSHTTATPNSTHMSMSLTQQLRHRNAATITSRLNDARAVESTIAQVIKHVIWRHF
jgi:hypothetical protein